MKKYDAAFVPCKEPDLITGLFPEHHDRALQRVLELKERSEIEFIVLSGRYATRYTTLGITPWFGTECGESAIRLIKRGCPPEAILEDPDSQDSTANFLCSGETIFVPRRELSLPRHERIETVLVVAADERLERLKFLGRKLLRGVVDLEFASIGAANDPWLDLKERFTLAIQKKYLENIADGPAGWPELKSWFYSKGQYPFWMSFDTAEQAMPPPPEGSVLDISEIIANMDHTGLPPDIMDFAIATAKKLTPVNR